MGAVAMVTQAVVSLMMWKVVRDIKDRVFPLIPEAQSALVEAKAAIAEGRAQIREVGTRAAVILDSAKVQMARVEEVVTDAASRARNQLDRTEMVVQDTVTRVHETVSAVQGTILRPIKEVNGLAAGVKAGLSLLLKGNRPSVDRATQDEEMFI